MGHPEIASLQRQKCGRVLGKPGHGTQAQGQAMQQGAGAARRYICSACLGIRMPGMMSRPASGGDLCCNGHLLTGAQRLVEALLLPS